MRGKKNAFFLIHQKRARHTYLPLPQTLLFDAFHHGLEWWNWKYEFMLTRSCLYASYKQLLVSCLYGLSSSLGSLLKDKPKLLEFQTFWSCLSLPIFCVLGPLTISMLFRPCAGENNCCFREKASLIRSWLASRSLLVKESLFWFLSF